jgi:hypothetical protein
MTLAVFEVKIRKLSGKKQGINQGLRPCSRANFSEQQPGEFPLCLTSGGHRKGAEPTDANDTGSRKKKRPALARLA